MEGHLGVWLEGMPWKRVALREDLQSLMGLEDDRSLVHCRRIPGPPPGSPRQLEVLFEKAIHRLPLGRPVVVTLRREVAIFDRFFLAVQSIDASHEREFNLGRSRGPVAPARNW